jgi:ribosomal protein L12E/L44/L45/RPP1/RPP2
MNAAQSPEMQLRIQEWRAKARQGTLSQDEMREAIAALRRDRGAIPQASAGSKVTKTRKAAAAKPNSDDLLSELDGL